MTDNESVVHVINKQTSRDTYLLSLIRKVVLTCLRNNILFRAKHIPGIKNGLADSLSRLQVDKFKSLSHGMDRVPTPPPPPTRTPEAGHLGDTLRRLLEASLNTASLHMYRRPWKIFTSV